MTFKKLVLLLIRGYQRHISPRKGYSCAHRILNGGVGCSGYGYRAIEVHGFVTGLALLRRRFKVCGDAAAKLQRPRLRPALLAGPGRTQAGFCDAGCDIPVADCHGCDMPATDCHGGDCGHVGLCNVGDCLTEMPNQCCAPADFNGCGFRHRPKAATSWPAPQNGEKSAGRTQTSEAHVATEQTDHFDSAE